MARARIIKPGFFKNEVLAECSLAARMLFSGLWTLADRAGRLEDRPKRIKADLFPYDDLNIDELLNELAARGFIARYSIDGNPLIQIDNFEKHQKPHRNEVGSVLPAQATETPPEKPELEKSQPNSEQDVPKSEHSGLNLNPDYLNQKDDDEDARARNQIIFQIGERIAEITGWKNDPRWFGNYSLVEVWIRQGFDAEKDIIPTVKAVMAKRGKQDPPSNLKYFDKAIAQAFADRTRTIAIPEGKNHEDNRRNHHGSNGKSRAAREVIAEELAREYGPANSPDTGSVALAKL
jgi:hypothetical protein